MRMISQRASSFANSHSASCRHVDEITRRHLLRLFGGAGLASAALLKLGNRPALAQDEGTPMPMATAQLGPRDDGSTVWRVKAGDMQMEEKTEYHSYFPGEITINEGDAIWFDFGMGGFHTASFLSGGEVPLIIIPDPEQATPTAGPPTLILNPALVFPMGGDTYDGTGYVSSGIDVFRDPSQPYVLTFTKAGSHDYLCGAHANVMKGKVVVQAAGTAAAHTQEEYDQLGTDQLAELEAQAKAELDEYAEATSTANADGTTAWTATVGAGGETPVRIQAILPLELEVKVGDTVTWVHRAPGEPHTVSFLGEGEIPPEDPVEQFADGSPKFVQNPLILFPQGGDVWSGTGWVNSGFMGIPMAGPSVTEHTLTFDTPGDYIYFCFLHGDANGERMAAKITVTAG
jgi:plastocyanin